MGRALFIVFLLIIWAQSLLQSDFGFLSFLQNMLSVLLIFKVALTLDDLVWWVNFTKTSLIRQLRKGRFK